MPGIIDIQLGTTGELFPSENGNFYVAFNDIVYNNNTGFYIFNLYLSGELIKSVTVPGNVGNWQLVTPLLGGNNYSYSVSGYVSNGDLLWGPDGWIGYRGETVALNSTTLNYGPYNRQAFYQGAPDLADSLNFRTTVINPYFPLDTDVYVNGYAQSELIIIYNPNKVPFGFQGGDRGELGQIVGDIELISGFNFLMSQSEPNGFIPWRKDRFDFAFGRYNPGMAGGNLSFTFIPRNQQTGFLVPELFAYSLVGQFRSQSSTLLCLNIISTNNTGVQSTGTATGSGYYTYTPPVLTDRETFNQSVQSFRSDYSGYINFSIESLGDVCSSNLYNKVSEIKINSYFNKDIESNINIDFEKPQTSYSKYLSYTNDIGYDIYYTGYITGIYSVPVTNITGVIEQYGYLSGFVPHYTTGIDNVVTICYKYEQTGFGITGSGTGITYSFYGEALTGVSGSGSGFITYYNFTYQSGTGVIKETISGFDPEMFIYENKNNLISYNDDWQTSFYAAQIRDLISGQSITLPAIESANLFNIVGSSGFDVIVKKSPKYELPDNFFRIKETTLKLIEDNPYQYNKTISSMASWASYNVSSGTNSKNVIGYAIEIINDLILSGQEVFDTGNSRNIPPDLFYTGSDIRSEYIAYCFTNKSIECKDKEIPDITVCYTGDPEGSGYRSFVSGVLQRFKDSAITEYDAPGTLSISSGIIPSYFRIWSGTINYNTFQSGDKLIFDLYPFDYTGLYKQYFSTNPIYPSTGVTFEYGVDFNSIESLVDSINNKLSGISYPVWYPYECVSGSGNNGIYLSGNGLVGASIRSLDTGDKNYRNIVDFYSLRNNTGFKFNLSLSNREITKIDNESKLKYLLPSFISLQGSNNNSTWTTLHSISGIDWTKIEPLEKEFTGLKSGIPDNLNIINIEEEEDFNIELSGISGGFQTLYSFTQNGSVKNGESCPPLSFSREISIVKPTGFPPGVQFDSKTCAPTGDEFGLGEKDKKDEGGDGSGNPDNIYKASYLRTGWVLNEIEAGQPITGINYDYYRIYLSGFEANNTKYETLTSTFIVNNINLYSCVVNEIGPHTGKSICAIGSDYTLDIEGYIPVTLTGLFTGYIKPSDSGLFNIKNQTVLMKISGLNEGDYVKFNKQSGKLTTSSGSGVITDIITGSGCFTTGVVDWIYNPNNNIITFEQQVTGCLNGSGKISGQYIRIKPSVVNQQLAQGGFLNSSFFVSVTTGVTFTGLANSEILFENLPCSYTYTGITGGIGTGVLNISEVFNQTLNSELSDYISGGITGYKNASAYLYYNSPQSFDWISINGFSISYNADSGNWTAPGYYATSGQLIDIINQNPSVFLCSGFVDNGNIKLQSLLSGKSGNNILLDWGTGINSGTGAPSFYYSSFTGGKDLYQKIYGTGLFTGLLEKSLIITGFYNDIQSGIITGNISTFQGERTFTGIWGISTGNFFTGYKDFLTENYLINNNKYYNIVGGTGFAISPSNIDISIIYRDLFDTQLNSDIVKLTISGSGISGISMLITGYYSII